MAGIKALKTPSQARALAPPRRGAWAATLRGLVELAADFVPGCYLVLVWVLCATNAGAIFALRTFGRDSLAMAFAKELIGAVFPSAVLLRVALFLLSWSVPTRTPVIPEFGWMPLSEAAQRSLATSFMVWFVGLLMVLLAPTKELWLWTASIMVTDTGCFLCSVTFCVIITPQLKRGAARLY